MIALRRTWGGVFAVPLLLASLVPAAFAQSPSTASERTFPSRAVRLIVPFPPGGGGDVFARLVAQGLSPRLAQAVVVENRPGGNGLIGVQAVARSAADGDVVLCTTKGEIVILPNVVANMPVDTLRDLVPVVKAAAVPRVVMVAANSTIGSMRELIEQARANPGRFSYGTSSVGSSMHLALEALKEFAGVDYLHIAYKGGAPAITDLLAGQIQFASTGLPGVLGQLRSGRIKVIAVIGDARSALLPDVPSIREATGYALPELPTWFGFWAPAGVPSEILARLEREIIAALADSELRTKLAAIGVTVNPEPAARYAASLPAELAAFGAALRRVKIRPE